MNDKSNTYLDSGKGTFSSLDLSLCHLFHTLCHESLTDTFLSNSSDPITDFTSYLINIRGRLATFIENFLADRWIQVRVGSTLSETFDQAQGVPQGSILSTTLFNIKINSIMDCLDPKTDGSLYVDDFRMCYRSKSMRTIVRHTAVH